MKKRKIKKVSQKKGLPPDFLVYTGDNIENFEITVIDYDPESYREFNVQKIEEYFSFKDFLTVSWFNIIGLHKVDMIQKFGERFGLHPLVLEDILNVHQRSKVEYFEGYVFVIVKMLTYNDESHDVESEQVSMILGKNFVFTFQEREGGCF